MVDPSDGTLKGIIDWEFANTLPLQAAEQYPGLLADKARFVKEYNEKFPDAGGELERWRAEQFKDDSHISVLHERIDAILGFERLLRNMEDCTRENFASAVNALKEVNALVGSQRVGHVYQRVIVWNVSPQVMVT